VGVDQGKSAGYRPTSYTTEPRRQPLPPLNFGQTKFLVTWSISW